MMDYSAFLERKSQMGKDDGFDPIWIPDWLFDFQRSLVEWAIRKGRAAIFADCGLGKTLMQLVWAENVVRKTGKPVLILTPLAVSHQTERESSKFGIESARSVDGSVSTSITITNYERLHYFNQNNFSGVVCDESSILKNYGGKRRTAITEFCRKLPYRLLCTATAAPNDHWELGTSSEALGYLGFKDMLSRFFKQETRPDFGFGRATYRFRGHAEDQFWRWVCSWARVCRRPSDLGYADHDFILPDLREHEHIVVHRKQRPGMLFAMPAKDLQEQREERRMTIEERCSKAAELCIGNGASVLWCHLNKEANRLESLIPDAKQVSGSMPDERKEELLLAFQTGELPILVTKPKIGCFGLNWQHCHNVVTFPSHSWEQYYQAVRRCLRFGQLHAVDVHMVSTEGEHHVLKNLQRKASQADGMFTSLASHVNDELRLSRSAEPTIHQRTPQWLCMNKS
jgi:hypothetical protein